MSTIAGQHDPMPPQEDSEGISSRPAETRETPQGPDARDRQSVELSEFNTTSQPGLSGAQTALAEGKGTAEQTSVQQRAQPSDSDLATQGVTSAAPSGVPPGSNRDLDSGIGPATDKPSSVTPSTSQGPRLIITLLQHSTETRHPYNITGEYLARRSVTVPQNNPVNMSVYTLKELIWIDWREEWEPRPSSPSSIRLIHMGRLLDDKTNLKDSRFSVGDTPHVVHMTVKPQEVVDEEDARMAKGGSRERDGRERSPRCRCTVM